MSGVFFGVSFFFMVNLTLDVVSVFMHLSADIVFVVVNNTHPWLRTVAEF